jgi:hypothetical protein
MTSRSSGATFQEDLKTAWWPGRASNWYWGVVFRGRSQPASQRGNCPDLEGCKRRFKTIWSGIPASLSHADFEATRKVEVYPDKRFKKWPT